MIIVCDRCRKNTVDFEERSEWMHIEIYKKGSRKLDDYYFCKECSRAFYKFLSDKAGGEND